MPRSALTFSINQPHSVPSWQSTVVMKERTQDKHPRERPQPRAGSGESEWSRPRGRIIYVDVIVSSMRVCSFIRCAVITWGWGGGQRARLLTDLIYQPWRSQLVGDLKTRWRRAENDENVEAERFNKAWAFKKMFLNKFTDSTTQTRQRSIFQSDAIKD